ncbi:MAG: efflux RND transporter periplasmic adaptor subunit [Ignavibacteria bacterium]|nr:efflux RND transporter periplasmic adaptor subunit [Ignavibacteria bacterium]
MTTGEPRPDIHSLRIDRTETAGAPGSGKGKYYLLGGGILLAAILAWILRDSFSPVREVEATTVSMVSLSQANAVLTASGYVVAQQKASIASKGTGRLVFLGVEEGDVVKKGEVIARLEDHDVNAALARAKADLQLARADSFDAVNSYSRESKLFESGLTSQASLDGAQARLWRTIATIRSAEAAVAEAMVALENTRIRAPFDGTVLTKDADVGEVVAPFASSANSRAAVVTMADMSSLEVEADVSESNITRVSAGQRCEIVLDAYPDVRYPGYVHKIVPTADRAKATVLTKVRFTERDDRVLPEMSAKVTFMDGGSDAADQPSGSVLSVRESAIVTADGSATVFLLEGEQVRRVPVDTGRRIGDRIEIRSGLASGDRVILRPPPDLTDGDRVVLH